MTAKRTMEQASPDGAKAEFITERESWPTWLVLGRTELEAVRDWHVFRIHTAKHPLVIKRHTARLAEIERALTQDLPGDGFDE